MKEKIKIDNVVSFSKSDLKRIVKEKYRYDSYTVYLAKKELQQRKIETQIKNIRQKNNNVNQSKGRVIDFKKIYAIGIILIAFILIGLAVLHGPPKPKTNYSVYDSFTTGVVTDIKESIVPSQHLDGNKFVIYGYIICFKYEVKGISYSNEMLLPNNRHTDKIINRLLNKKNPRIITVRYKSKNPKKSIVEVESI